MAGGLGSVAAGGKFENGALTGALGYLFNQIASSAGRAASGAASSGCNLCVIQSYDALGVASTEKRMTWEEKYARNVGNLISRANDLMGPGYVYSLRATIDGFYPQLRDGFSLYMRAGDVWKYGETYTPETRYTRSFFNQYSLEMKFELPVTNMFNAKIAEQSLLYIHTFLHGDLPPGNRIMR